MTLSEIITKIESRWFKFYWLPIFKKLQKENKELKQIIKLIQNEWEFDGYDVVIKKTSHDNLAGTAILVALEYEVKDE